MSGTPTATYWSSTLHKCVEPASVMAVGVSTDLAARGTSHAVRAAPCSPALARRIGKTHDPQRASVLLSRYPGALPQDARLDRHETIRPGLGERLLQQSQCVGAAGFAALAEE